MEKECISKEPIQFANDTQLENTTMMMKGFKWIYNDPSMSYNTWKKKRDYKTRAKLLPPIGTSQLCQY